MRMVVLLSLSLFVLIGCDQSNSKDSAIKEQLSEIPKDLRIDEFVEKSMSTLTGEHPSLYFELVNTLYENDHFDQSAFVFYIGNYSYKLYNHANPDYTKADQHNFDMVSFTYGFENYDYLQSDLDNYSKIVFECLSWYSKNPPKYFSNQKEDKFYKEQLKELEILAVQLRDDPEGFKRDLEEERKEFEKKLNEAF